MGKLSWLSNYKWILFMMLFMLLTTILLGQIEQDPSIQLGTVMYLYDKGELSQATEILEGLYQEKVFNHLEKQERLLVCLYYSRIKFETGDLQTADAVGKRMNEIEKDRNKLDQLIEESTRDPYRAWVKTKIANNYAPITIISRPSGAEAIFDLKIIGTTPCVIDDVFKVDPHEIMVRKVGYEDYRFKGILNFNDSLVVVLVPEPSELQTKSIEITSKPQGAIIYLDGRKQELKTNATIEIASGRHEISAKKGWLRNKIQTSFQTQNTDSLHFNLGYNWLRLGGGAALLAGGIIYGLRECIDRDDNGCVEKLPAPPDPPSQ